MNVPLRLVACSLFVLTLFIPNGRAQTSIVVTELNDELVTDGDCSLREAVIAANTDAAQDACPAGSDTPGGATDEIVLPAGTIWVSFPGLRSEDAAASGDLDLTEGVKITGQGAGVTIIDGSSATGQGDGLFDVRSANNRISGVTMESIAPSLGWNGAIFVQSGASLIMEDSEILNGASVSSSAGAIWINGSMEIHNSTVSGNQSQFKAGGIYVNFASLVISSSTISNNSAYDAGGIYANNSTVTITNSTISGNQATNTGDGLLVTDFGNSNVDLVHSTFANNDVTNQGTTPVYFANTIVTGGVAGNVSSGGYNVVDSGSGFTASGDQVGANPELGALQDNGGPTFSHAIASGSPARDADATCSVSTDQRGYSRNDGACDSGAFEYAAVLPVELVSFQATVDQGSVFLTWRTASEQDNAGFDVEHQASDTGPWERLHFVAGQGTASEATEYSFRVENLGPGRHRFRLKQIDLDGSHTYSEMIEVFVAVAALEGHKPSIYHLGALYPNPLSATATMTVSVDKDSHLRAVLYDVAGRQIRSLFDGFVSAGVHQHVTVSAVGLPSGLYLIRLTGDAFGAVRPVVISR